MISVVLPTVPGREAILERVVGAYERTSPELEVIIERDSPACGIGWQRGAEKARGEFLLLGADDLEPCEGWWGPLLQTARDGMVPCPVVLEPDGSVQSAGAIGWELQRQEPADFTATGWTTVPFLSREQWSVVDPMLPLHYCTDTWVSAKLRALRGQATVVRTGSRFVHHNAAPGRGAGMDIHARNIHDRARFTEALEGLAVLA